jgi:hypothetical protein
LPIAPEWPETGKIAGRVLFPILKQRSLGRQLDIKDKKEHSLSLSCRRKVYSPVPLLSVLLFKGRALSEKRACPSLQKSLHCSMRSSLLLGRHSQPDWKNKHV